MHCLNKSTVLIVVTEIMSTVTLKERFGAFIYINLQVEKEKEENLLW